MRIIVARLAGSLRNGIRRACYSNRSNLRVSRLPVISASLTAGALLVSSDHYSARDIEPRQLPALPEIAAETLPNVSSVRDVPQLVSDTFSGVYSRIRHGILKRVDTEGGAAIVSVTAANIAVYLLWKGAPTSFMVRHFANSLEAVRKGRVWTSFTSNFSHMSVFHLAANMYLLNRFGPDVADVLGNQRFYMFYGTAGVASSLASLTFRRLTKSNVLSLGASGGVVSVLWLYACFFPDRRMAILGSEKTVSMQELVLAYTVIDAAGLLGSLGKIDFAAHLGGALFGNSWFYLVRDKLVREEAARRRGESRSLFKYYLGSKGGSRNGD